MMTIRTLRRVSVQVAGIDNDDTTRKCNNLRPKDERCAIRSCAIGYVRLFLMKLIDATIFAKQGKRCWVIFNDSLQNFGVLSANTTGFCIGTSA